MLIFDLRLDPGHNKYKANYKNKKLSKSYYYKNKTRLLGLLTVKNFVF